MWPVSASVGARALSENLVVEPWFGRIRPILCGVVSLEAFLIVLAFLEVFFLCVGEKPALDSSTATSEQRTL